MMQDRTRSHDLRDALKINMETVILMLLHVLQEVEQSSINQMIKTNSHSDIDVYSTRRYTYVRY